MRSLFNWASNIYKASCIKKCLNINNITHTEVPVFNVLIIGNNI